MEKQNKETVITEDEILYYTLAEACEVMKICRNTMLRLVNEKGFPAIRFNNGPYLIDKAALPIWVSKHYGNYKL